jgi:hypothetical protein
MYTGGVYVRSKYLRTTEEAATDPWYVTDPSGTPTECSDIVHDWFSDDFDGGTLDTYKWYNSGSGSAAISSGKLAQSISHVGAGAAGQYTYSYVEDADAVTGDFDCQVDFDSWSSTKSGADTGIQFRVAFPSSPGANSIQWRKQYFNGVGEYIQVLQYLNGTATSPVYYAFAANSGVLRIARVSGTVYCYVDGTLKHSYSQSGAIQTVLLGVFAYGTNTQSVNWNDFEFDA